MPLYKKFCIKCYSIIQKILKKDNKKKDFTRASTIAIEFNVVKHFRKRMEKIKKLT